MTRRGRSTWRRPSPTAPTTSWWGGRSARRRTRAPPPRRSRRPSPLSFLPSEELPEQPLEVRMDGEQRAVKQQALSVRHPDGGEILDFEVADFVGLVLDVDPAELGARKLLRERKEARAVLAAGMAPLGAKAADDHHA